MIVSKSELALVEVTKVDKNIPALNCVHFCQEGTVASNGEIVVVMSPISDAVKNAIPFEEKSKRFTATVVSDTISDVLKNLPNDSTFKGALEFCNIDLNSDGKIVFETTDGKNVRKVLGKTFPYQYIPWRKIVREHLKKIHIGNDQKNIILNNKSFSSLLSSLTKISGTKDIPVYLSGNGDGSIVFRTVMPKTLQRIVAVTLPARGQWLEPDNWEQSLSIVAKKKTQ